MTIKKGNIAEKIGFIQGRLSKVENNRIQVFPIKNWKIEFQVASVNNINKIEWTIDSETISDNPLINSETLTKILELMNHYSIQVPSVTCDYFMEKPPWQESERDLEDILTKIMKNL
jgi:hypothetical protein